MIGKAISKNISCSPYKLRPLTDVIREKSVLFALNWLESAYINKKAVPLQKVIYSAVANMLQKENISIKMIDAGVLNAIKFVDLRVDQGSIRKYFRPGPQGKAIILRSRYAHITVVVGCDNKIITDQNYKQNIQVISKKGVSSGSKS